MILSADAARMLTDEPCAVDLLYDAERGRIAIRKNEPGGLHRMSSMTSPGISCREFLEAAFGPPERQPTDRLAAVWNEAEQMLEVEIGGLADGRQGESEAAQGSV